LGPRSWIVAEHAAVQLIVLTRTIVLVTENFF